MWWPRLQLYSLDWDYECGCCTSRTRVSRSSPVRSAWSTKAATEIHRGGLGLARGDIAYGDGLNRDVG
jgi:hypothetical protein